MWKAGPLQLIVNKINAIAMEVIHAKPTQCCHPVLDVTFISINDIYILSWGIARLYLPIQRLNLCYTVRLPDQHIKCDIEASLHLSHSSTSLATD